jgi:hypothetical protein
MLLRVTATLGVPYRERNEVLLAAGYAPAFPDRRLDDPSLTPVRSAVRRVLSAHDPYPGFAFDRGWNLVGSNRGAVALADRDGVAPALLEPPVNVLRLSLHPDGLAPYILNLGDWRTHFLDRLARQVATTGDPSLTALLDELSAYPVGDQQPAAGAQVEAAELLGSVRFRAPDGGEWSFFGMFAGFDTPFEVTTSELALEMLFPADERTRETFGAAS